MTLHGASCCLAPLILRGNCHTPGGIARILGGEEAQTLNFAQWSKALAGSAKPFFQDA